MVFKTDKQRKKVMAELTRNQPRAETRPTIIGRLRKRFRPTAEELREQRGARIQREAEALRSERLRVQQLETEAQLESERETVRRREERARAKLKEIDVTRRERRLAPIREKVARVRVGVARAVEVGKRVAVGAERITRPKPRRKRARPRREEPEGQGFFGI